MSTHIMREMVMDPDGRFIRHTPINAEQYAVLVDAGYVWTEEQCQRWVNEGIRPDNYHSAKSNLRAIYDAKHESGRAVA